MDKTAATTVMANRISWSKFDSIRKQALCDEVKKTDGTDTQNPPKKHGWKPEALCVDKENLLQEAQSWSPTQNINWSELARRYGLNKKNGGQCIKEYLKQHNIPSAFLDQTPNRNQRRRRKTLPGGIHFQCISLQKKVLAPKQKTQQQWMQEKYALSIFKWSC